MVQATTNAQAMSIGKRTLTQDGMLVGKGTIDRLRPVSDGDLRIGRDGGSQHLNAANQRLAACEDAVSRIEARKSRVDALIKVLRLIPPDGQAQTSIKDFWDEAASADGTAMSLEGKLKGAADEGYVQLGKSEEEWAGKASDLSIKVTDANGLRSTKETLFKEREDDFNAATSRVESANKASDEARNDPDYDAGYASSYWDAVLEKFGESFADMASHCEKQIEDARKQVTAAVTRGSNLLGDFLSKHREQAGDEVLEDWRKGQAWMSDTLRRLRDTDL